jgi:hypothetical protein
MSKTKTIKKLAKKLNKLETTKAKVENKLAKATIAKEAKDAKKDAKKAVSAEKAAAKKAASKKTSSKSKSKNVTEVSANSESSDGKAA